MTISIAIAHGFLNRERYRIFADLTRQYLPRESRHIRRPTSYYGRMLESSLAPAAMADGFARSVMLRAACGEAVVPRRWLRLEVRALENGDIPRLKGKGAGIRNSPTPAAVGQAVETIKLSLTHGYSPPRQ